MLTLKDKFRGCIAGSWIGSAMGAPVEGWSTEKIKSTFGIVDKLLPYKHYIEFVDWERPAGTTEDGIERQKLIATAIIEKKDRITAEDLAKIWKRDLDPEKMIYKQEPYDRSLCLLLKAGAPYSELGRLSLFSNVVTLARASHPLGLINAGDPESAASDTFEIGKLYFSETAIGLRWAALYNAAIAEACKPNASLTSVIDTAVKYAEFRAENIALYKCNVEKFSYDTVKSNLLTALEIAEKSSDYEELKNNFYKIYDGGYYITYGLATAAEIVSKGIAIFYFFKGNVKESIIGAVNFGRDTDCVAAVAGGISGALTGTSSIPEEWIKQVNEATKKDPYTNNKRTIEETADSLYEAFQEKQKRLLNYIQLMQNY